MGRRADELPTLPARGDRSPGAERRLGAPAGSGDPAGEAPAKGEASSVGARKRALGRYRLLFRLARGGMGSVFAAVLEGAHGVERPVAIKLLNSQDQTAEEIDAFVQEARLTARIAHPNVLENFELGVDDGEPFLVMPLVRGVSLAQVMKGGEPLEPEVAAWIAAQVAAGLHAAHELRDEAGDPLGVIHRDVSPQNILVSYEGRVILVDFGVAKLFEGARATASGVIKGKFGYMAPEQLRGEPLDRRTDVFALGIVLWEMSTGRLLYADLPPAQATLKITTGPTPRARDIAPTIPAELDDVIAACLAKDAGDRFASALEVKDALRAFLRARGATVDETEVGALVASRFAAERDDLDARLRAALAGKSLESAEPEPDAASDPPLPSQASKITLVSGADAPPRKERGAWPFVLLGGGALGAAALALALGGESSPPTVGDVAAARPAPTVVSAPAAPADSSPAETSAVAAVSADAPAPPPEPSPAASSSAPSGVPATPAHALPPPSSAKTAASATPAGASSKPESHRGEPFRTF